MDRVKTKPEKPKPTKEKLPDAKERVAKGGNYFAAPKKDMKFISTGCKVLDLAMGGGWVEGRISNIVGDKATAKTLLCIEAAANFAMKYPKGNIYYRESEAAFDEKYAEALGMPMSRVDFGEKPATVEDFFEDLTAIAKGAKQPALYILDSLDALSDRAEMDREIDQGSYGASKAKKMSELFRRTVRSVEKSQVTVIIVSQIRDSIGAMFGRKTTRSGGRALDFYASLVLYLTYTGRMTRTKHGVTRPVGISVKAMVDKNKVSLPYREAEFEVRFGYGIDDAAACLNFLKNVNSLKEVGVTKEEIKDKARQLLKLSTEEYAAEMKKIHEVTERRWFEIEEAFMPPRSKYGAKR